MRRRSQQQQQPDEGRELRLHPHPAFLRSCGASIATERAALALHSLFSCCTAEEWRIAACCWFRGGLVGGCAVARSLVRRVCARLCVCCCVRRHLLLVSVHAAIVVTLVVAHGRCWLICWS